MATHNSTCCWLAVQMPVPRRKLFHLAFQVCWHLNEVIMKAVLVAVAMADVAATAANLPQSVATTKFAFFLHTLRS